MAASCVAVQEPATTSSAGTSSTVSATVTIPPTTTRSPLPPPESITATTRPSTFTLPPIPPCLTSDPPFAREGEVGAYSPLTSDSALLAAIDWQAWEVCDRLLFSLASTGGAPTLVPPAATLTSLAEEGVMRLRLGAEVETSALSFQLVETASVDRLYVVADPDGGLIVDIHLAQPASARMVPSSAPAILTVDLRPQGPPFGQPPVIGSRAVLFPPSDREGTRYPLVVGGYVTPGIGESVATLTSVGGQVRETPLRLAGAHDLWSGFAAVFLEGPVGWTTIQVEDARARLFLEE